MFSFQQKIIRHAKRLKKKKYRLKRKQASELDSDIAEMLELSEKEFKNNYD